ncbi:MAG: hypothetical protein EA425_15455 [Puniceicoccaceae bacterium]|nr:MAG: hypothetical protein EA425_15455 [Puniceicoccaceae bacterium]
MKSRSLLFTGVGQVELAEIELPDPAPDEVVVESVFTCISPGTELRCLAGKQNGNPEFPFIPGYALSGRVVGKGAAVKLAEGTRVFASGTRRVNRNRCWGGHVAHAVLPAAEVVPLPENIGWREAASAKLAAIAYHGVRLSHPYPHERVAVIGLGCIGRFSAHLHALTGARTLATDLSPRRRASAEAAGLEVRAPADPLATTFASEWPEGAEVVVDATGSGRALEQTAAMARTRPWDNQLHPQARLVLQGSYAADPVLPFYQLFGRELQALVPRDCQRRDIEAVLDLMARGLLRPETFIDEIDSPEKAPEVYAQLRDRPDERIGAAFRWRGDPGA